MEPDEVRGLLRAYKENKSRVSYLEAEAAELRKGIWAEEQPEMQAIHAQRYFCTPPPSFTSSKTEMLALSAVDGMHTETTRRWSDELNEIEQELRKARLNVARVDVWMRGLTDRERAIITAHEIEREPWYKVSFQSEKLIGQYLGQERLRGIGKQALKKICTIAR